MPSRELKGERSIENHRLFERVSRFVCKIRFVLNFISDYLYISKREKCVLDRDIFYIARGFLLREISMIVSSVDNGRTFYDYERK